MPWAARFLQTNSGQFPAAEPPVPLAASSNVVVIQAVLLCALICLLGLALVARCAWLRRHASGAGPSNKGLKKKALRSLPKLPFDRAVAGGKLSDCPICLAEFSDGDEIRILPQCGHGFHAGCVDTWLGSHSSCPFCRRILVVAAPSRYQMCGSSSATAAEVESGAKAREDVR